MPHIDPQIGNARNSLRQCCKVAIVALAIGGPRPACQGDDASPSDKTLVKRTLRYGEEVIEQLQLPGKPEITVVVQYERGAAKPMPVMLNWYGQRERKLGELTRKLAPTAGMTLKAKLPNLQPTMANLMKRGCAVVSFLNAKPKPRPWPKGKAKWIWPTPDPAGAQTFAASAKHSPGDWGLVIDWIETRKDLRADRIGYMGGSTTAIIGYGLISTEPRITCAALLAGSGSMRRFVEGWKRNYDWKAKGFEVWPETEALLKKWDPALLVDRVFPTALLMINGSDDKIIPIESARHYYRKIRPYYVKDPDRLRFIVFEGAGHGWDQKWNNFMAVDWFERYLIQEKPPKPRPRRRPRKTARKKRR